MSIRINARDNRDTGQQGQAPWDMRQNKKKPEPEGQEDRMEIRIPDSPPQVYTAKGRLVPLNKFLHNS